MNVGEQEGMEKKKYLKKISAILVSMIFVIGNCSSITVAETVFENTAGSGEEEAASGTVSENEISAETDLLAMDGAGDEISGTEGNLSWSIDSEGVLRITETGDYSYRPDWCNYTAKIKKAEVNITGITSTYMMFYGCSNLESIEFIQFDTSEVENMDCMFYGCNSLKYVDVTGFNTSKVKNMSDMFVDCRSLDSLDISGFVTSKVTDMGSMFYNC